MSVLAPLLEASPFTDELDAHLQERMLDPEFRRAFARVLRRHDLGHDCPAPVKPGPRRHRTRR